MWTFEKGAFSPASQTPVVPFYNMIHNNSETLQTHANGTWYCKKPVSPRDRRTPLGSCKASSRSLVNLTRVDGRKPEISDDCHPFSWWDSCVFVVKEPQLLQYLFHQTRSQMRVLSNHARKYRKQEHEKKTTQPNHGFAEGLCHLSASNNSDMRRSTNLGNLVLWLCYTQIREEGDPLCSMIFQVPVKGGRYYIIPPIGSIYHLYIAFWEVICYLPPFTGTRNNDWCVCISFSGRLMDLTWFNHHQVGMLSSVQNVCPFFFMYTISYPLLYPGYADPSPINY